MIITPKKNRFFSPALASLLSLLLAPSGAQALTSTFTATIGSPADYQDSTNWSNGVPNAVGDSAIIAADIAGSTTYQINLNGAVTLGNLNIGDTANPPGFYSLQNGTGGSLTFDATAGNATLQKTLANSTTDTIGATTTLVDTLSADIRLGILQYDGLISGARYFPHLADQCDRESRHTRPL